MARISPHRIEFQVTDPEGRMVRLRTLVWVRHVLVLRRASKESVRAFLKIMTQAASTIIEGQEFLREWRAQRDGQSKKAKVGVA